ncbi:B12-binding domain-containing radical SAM protein [bacterium]|nr:B12-binding domain-containing radical SAM protein [bacterium]
MEKRDIKILFVYMRTMKVFVASIASLSAFAKSNGFTNTKVTCILDAEMRDKNYESIFKKQIGKYDPDIVCISALTNYWPEIKKITDWIKDVSNAKILCGGYHASLFPDQVMSHPSVDGICIGEGEDAIVDVLNTLPDGSWENIPNIWSRSGNEIIKNDPRPFRKDINDYPVWDRDVFEENGINGVGNTIIQEFVGDKKAATVAASRGCFHKCSYCSNHAFRCLYAEDNRKGFVRKFEVDRLMKELIEIDKRYLPEFYEFVDEVFPTNSQWLQKFKKEYCRYINKPFSACIRIGMFNEEGYKILRESGCFMVYVGIECGNEDFRANVLNKRIKNADIEKHFLMLKKLGIKATTFNMVGLPMETKSLIQETIEFNRKIGSNYPLFFSYQPLPGTQLYDLCLEKDLIKNLDGNDNYYNREARLKLDITNEELNKCWDDIKALQVESAGDAQMFLV